MFNPAFKQIVLIFFIFLLFANAYGDNTPVGQMSVSVEAPFARATPPKQQVTGVFMRLKNHTARDIALVAASSPAAKVTEIHETRMQGGVMRMLHIGEIRVPANGTVELKPGGLHIMLIGLKEQLCEDESIRVMLTFSDGSTQAVNVPVTKGR